MGKIRNMGSVVLRLEGIAANIKVLYIEKYNNKYSKINNRVLEQLKTLRKEINIWTGTKQ